MNPEVSIIIPTCNRPQLLKACLDLILPQLPADGSVEVIVCDDGVDNVTQMMIATQFPAITWLKGAQNGPGANRNLGAQSSKGRWLLFVDDDCLPQPGWLAEYRANFIMNKPTVEWFVGATYQNESRRSLLWEAPTYKGGQQMPPSCNFAMPKSLYIETKGFDERYLYSFEDMEFFTRLKYSGFSCIYLPGAASQHPYRRAPSSFKLAARWESRVIFALDQGASPFRILWGLPWHVLRVNQATFRKCSWTQENLLALGSASLEWISVLIKTPLWVKKWSVRPRSEFWVDRVSKFGPIAKFGF